MIFNTFRKPQYLQIFHCKCCCGSGIALSEGMNLPYRISFIQSLSLSTSYIPAPRYLFFLSLLGLPILHPFAGGDPNTPYHFRDMRSVQSRLAAS